MLPLLPLLELELPVEVPALLLLELELPVEVPPLPLLELELSVVPPVELVDEVEDCEPVVVVEGVEVADVWPCDVDDVGDATVVVADGWDTDTATAVVVG